MSSMNLNVAKSLMNVSSWLQQLVQFRKQDERIQVIFTETKVSPTAAGAKTGTVATINVRSRIQEFESHITEMNDGDYVELHYDGTIIGKFYYRVAFTDGSVYTGTTGVIRFGELFEQCPVVDEDKAITIRIWKANDDGALNTYTRIKHLAKRK